jgi:hypothetical protein
MRRVPLILVATGLWLAAAVPAWGYQIPVGGLLSDPSSYEGEITIEGELVGDYGIRSDGSVWTQLNDDTYAREPLLEGGALSGGNIGVGVRIPAELAEQLDPPGGYRKRGPVVRLTGLWMYHDPDRGGESYLEVQQLVVIEPGRELAEGMSMPALLAGVALILAAGAIWWWRPRPDGSRQRTGSEGAGGDR